MITQRTANEIEVLFNDGTRTVHTSLTMIVMAFLTAIVGLVLGASLSWAIIPAVFITISVIVAFGAYRLRSIFRKDTGVVLETTLILQKKTATRTIPLSDIDSVNYRTTYNSKAGEPANIHTASNVLLLLRDGSKIGIDGHWSHKTWGPWRIFFSSETVEPLESEAKALADFLNVPLTTRDLSPSGLVSSAGSLLSQKQFEKNDSTGTKAVMRVLSVAYHLLARLFVLAGIGVVLWVLYSMLTQ